MEFVCDSLPTEHDDPTDFQKFLVIFTSVFKPILEKYFNKLEISDKVKFMITYDQKRLAYCGRNKDDSSYYIVLSENFILKVKDFFERDHEKLKEFYGNILNLDYHVDGKVNKIVNEYTMIAFYFVIMHEVCHITRGHLNYAAYRDLQINASNPTQHDLSIDEFELNSSHPLTNTLTDSEIYNCECDADTTAGRMIFAYILDIMARMNKEDYNKNAKNLFLEMLSLSSCSLNMIFILFSQNRDDHNPYYPPSMLRGAISSTEIIACTIEFRENPRLPSWLRSINDDEINNSISVGLENAVKLAASHNLINIKYNLKTALDEWYKVDAKSLEDFHKIIEPHSHTDRP